jgi:hypothetical protein
MAKRRTANLETSDVSGVAVRRERGARQNMGYLYWLAPKSPLEHIEFRLIVFSSNRFAVFA